MLVHEKFKTLLRQVDALAAGTNPIVYFPPETRKFPRLPENAKAVIVSEGKSGDGVYFYLPGVTSEAIIRKAVHEDREWQLLGFVQNKEEVAKGMPVALVARDKDGVELKTAAIDGSQPDVAFQQWAVLNFQFPGSRIKAEPILKVLQERMA